MKITINDLDVTQYVILPLTTSQKLDESLDGKVMVLKGTPISTAFEPLDTVILTYDDDTEERWCVGTDTCKTQILGKNEFYTHEINLIEETKKLEGEPCCTMTFTNQLYYYADEPKQEKVEPIIDGGYGKVNQAIKNADVFYTPVSNLKPIYINSPYYFFKNICGLMVSGLSETSGYVEGNDFGGYLGKTEGFTIPAQANAGTCRVVYTGGVWYPGDTIFSARRVTVEYVFDINNATPLPYSRKSISDVVQMILLKHKTLNSFEDVKYYFNEEQKTKYSNVEAPEFTITQNTLFEALKVVANYVQCIPRLRGNEIYFDELGDVEIVDVSNDGVLKTNAQSIDMYCDNINSYVNNITNQQGNDGTVAEPNNRAFKTVRCESGNVIIQDDNVIIKTDYPIFKINKLTILEDGGALPTSDITKYVYEYNKYLLLSSYGEDPDNSKAFALYYKQNEKNIYGLNFIDDTNTLPDAFKHYAIANIAKLFSFPPIYLTTLTQLAFQIEYIPLVDLRVFQHKTYLGQAKNDRTLTYNQNENLVDSSAYGEHLKGVVARLGNNEMQLTFISKSLSNIPKLGKNTQYGYISEINIERYKGYLKYSINLSKDFNRISQYVGIKSNIRQYEISESMTQDRLCIYEDFLVVGKTPAELTINENKPLLTVHGIDNIRDIFYGNSSAQYGIHSSSIGIDEDNNGNFLTQIELPIIGYALGTSAIFYMSFEDNFSAGAQNLTTSGSTSVSTGRRVSQPVQYSSNIGEFTAFKINLNNYGITSSDLNKEYARANNFPKIDKVNFEGTTVIFSTTKNMDIKIFKDNRETIKFSYQLNCITDKDNVIIGSGMSKIFTNNNLGHLVGYILDRRISKFETIIKDVNESDAFYNFLNGVDGISYNTDYMYLKIHDKIANKQGKSLVFVDSKTNELLWGENIEINIGDTITPSVISFRHKKRI